MTSDTQRQGEAEYLINHPLMQELLDGIEHEAIEAGIQAAPDDDDTRRTAAFKVQAIRTLRRQLAGIAQPTKPSRRAAVI